VSVAAALAVLLACAVAWELAGTGGGAGARAARNLAGRLGAARVRALAGAALWAGAAGRIERAGLGGRLPVPTLLALKAGGALAGLGVAVAAIPGAPGRLGLLLACGLPAGGFVAPDALLERAARRRRARLIASLPDALDLLAVGIASGRSQAALIGDLARHSAGPLAQELALVVAEVECGAAQRDALEGLRRRVPDAAVGALAAALERSRRYGSPLAEQLHALAQGLRAEARRRIEERAARAAPKIQLVVALVLVPSVLLVIVAALIANADALLAGLA